ncbi:MAG: ABC transporter permease, partial [Gemmatimonadota bacterium]
ITTLALGIGANTAIFSVVDGILFRPLPFPDPEALVSVWTDVSERGGPPDEWLSWANYRSLEEDAASLESLAAWGGFRPTFDAEGGAEQVQGAVVSPGMFSDVLRVLPVRGRAFRASDDRPGASGVAVVSHGLWQRAFGGREDAVGQRIRLNGEAVEVIGIMPDRFRPPFVPDAELWMVPRLDPSIQLERRGDYSWRVIGRLADGATPESAGTELRVLGDRLEAEFPESNTDMSFRAVALRADLVQSARTGLLVLLAAVGFVLLVACVNVANLLLSRAASRREELAVRTALGAGRSRLVAQLLAEALLLAVAGGLAGVAVAYWGTDFLVALAPAGTPRLDEVAVDGRVLAITGLVTVLAGFAFGLVPALRAVGRDAHVAIRSGGRTRMHSRRTTRLRSALVVGQVALALVLLVGAGLLLRSFDNLRTFDLGFRPDGVLTMQVNLPGDRYESTDALRAFYDELHARLSAIPGVERVAFTSTVPLTGFDTDLSFAIEGEPVPGPGVPQAAWIRRVTPTYFETMGIDIVSGRAFSTVDDPDATPVVIINEAFARRYFSGRNPVGERITFGGSGDPTWREVVGVARDIRNFGIREDSRVAAYAPYHQVPTGFLFPVLRTSVPPERVASSARRALAEIDPGLAAGRVGTLRDIVAGALAPDRFVALLLSLFAGVAFVLAIVGLYGVVAYGVGRRLPEMGVRMALGAGSGEIAAMVVRQSLAMVAVGIVVGVLAAAALTRFIDALLFGVDPLDPATFVLVAAALAAAAAAAAAVPAVRAGRVDPVRVLAAE